MHEFSVMSQIVEAVLQEAKKHNVKSVDEVHLEIGELTFLGHEQMKFAYQVLTEKNMLKNSKVIISEKKAKIKCKKCSYNGKIEYEHDPSFHFSLPRFTCPKCSAPVEIVEGKECIIRRIVAEED
ncbi:MAG: hydrogenase maturation nickel metallochaperone HypA [Candidatus Thermoplasmatota archaeon]|nr:hydrogenase maturation nickel metallochaperone HypA [archaeon]MBU3902187.1 hydrogenase maturation nickel metallochaperone HypA [Candidatus Thermoplasmatota archaeon]